MRTLAGLNAHLHFTHLSKSSCGSLNSAFTDASSGKSSLAQSSCHQEGVLDLMQRYGVPLAQVCLLDPKAERILSPEDGDGRFGWFLFGVRSLQVQIFSSNHLAVPREY
jgi:ribosome biogenesis SPOUT family RNA methylase Rps3